MINLKEINLKDFGILGLWSFWDFSLFSFTSNSRNRNTNKM